MGTLDKGTGGSLDQPGSGAVTRYSGTNNIAGNGAATSRTVAHGYGSAPDASQIRITWTVNPLSREWITGIDATNFVVNVAAPSFVQRNFGWEILKVN